MRSSIRAVDVRGRGGRAEQGRTGQGRLIESARPCGSDRSQRIDRYVCRYRMYSAVHTCIWQRAAPSIEHSIHCSPGGPGGEGGERLAESQSKAGGTQAGKSCEPACMCILVQPPRRIPSLTSHPAAFPLSPHDHLNLFLSANPSFHYPRRLPLCQEPHSVQRLSMYGTSRLNSRHVSIDS